MKSSQTISLFSERPEFSQQPSSFFASILVHGAAIGLLSLGILYTPPIRANAERYSVRHLDLNADEPQTKRSGGSGLNYPGPGSAAPKLASSGKPSSESASLQQVVQAKPGPQTLIQPDLPTDLTLFHEAPVPNVVIWSAKKMMPRKIIPPQPEKPTAANVQPSSAAPNSEVNLADLEMSSTNKATKQPLLASTSTPVVVHGPQAVQQAPATTTKTVAEPTPVAVMSISDLHMPQGTVTLPPVNMSAAQNSPGSLTAGKATGVSQVAGSAQGANASHGEGSSPNGDAARSGNGNPASKGTGLSGTQGTGASGGDRGNAGNRNGGQTGPVQGAESGSGNGTGDGPSVAHITLPKEGQFASVVVGSSLTDKYPETATLWSGRLAYTVYMHVGLPKSWILQYSLPRADDAAAQADVTRLEAPWPYNIVRPNIPPGEINADALMVHGYVNQAGRFETLTIAFPAEFEQAKFVLNALAQWQFRPATQGGQVRRVEVLLIIPEVFE